MAWWQNAVVYQIYPRSFNDSNGDGIGDLPGIIAKLGYLQSLGVDAIWLSPMFPSPWHDGGYDVADYQGIHPDFGTMDDFDRLLEQAQQRQIRVILDLVPNHTSDQHPWFQESRRSRDNPKRDWYIWRDPKPDGSPPNNWQAFFGDIAWAYDETTEQYYLHSFLKEQPDLNWRNPQVREAMWDNIRFWLNKGVAGFRVDVIDFMMKDKLLRDEPPNPDYDPTVNIPRDQVLHIYSAYQDEVHDVIREMRTVFDEYDDRVFIGELTYEIELEKYMGYFGKNNDELMIPFNFQPLEMTLWGKTATAEQLMDYINRFEARLEPGQAGNWVFGNHDVPRLASRVREQARVYAMLLLTLRGSPFIYQGEELGMTNGEIPPEKQNDPFGINVPGQSRDVARTPIQWDASPHAGFTTPDADPWLPVAPNYKTVNAATQQQDPTSFLTLYRRLIDLRHRLSALNTGLYYPVAEVPSGIIAFSRQYNDQRVVVVLNFTGDARQINLTGLGRGRVMLSTLLDRDDETDLSALALRPYEGVVIDIPGGTQAVPRIAIDESQR